MLPIKTIMTYNVIYVKSSTPIYEALSLMSKNEISGMPVVNDDMEIVGIISEKDVLRILIERNLDVKSTVKDYMSTEVVTFTEEAGANEICKFFIRSHIRRVPIVKDGKLAGIVSRRDIVRLILESRGKMDPIGLI